MSYIAQWDLNEHFDELFKTIYICMLVLSAMGSIILPSILTTWKIDIPYDSQKYLWWISNWIEVICESINLLDSLKIGLKNTLYNFNIRKIFEMISQNTLWDRTFMRKCIIVELENETLMKHKDTINIGSITFLCRELP